jgi:hypothetical protein
VLSLIEVDPLVLEKKICKEYFQYEHIKIWFPYCGPIQPPRIMIWRNLNLHNVWKLSCKSELFWPNGSWEKDISKWPHLPFAFVIIPPLKTIWQFFFSKIEFTLPKNDLYQVWLKLADWFGKRRFLKIISNITHEKLFSLLWPHPTPGTMIWRNLNLNYVEKLSFKHELFYPSGSWEGL